MIIHFRHKGLRRLFEQGDESGFQRRDIPKIRAILQRLNSAAKPQDMAVRSLRLHPLKGKDAGYWAVSVRDNWRITFRFNDGDVRDVHYTDYH